MPKEQLWGDKMTLYPYEMGLARNKRESATISLHYSGKNRSTLALSSNRKKRAAVDRTSITDVRWKIERRYAGGESTSVPKREANGQNEESLTVVRNMASKREERRNKENQGNNKTSLRRKNKQIE